MIKITVILVLCIFIVPGCDFNAQKENKTNETITQVKRTPRTFDEAIFSDIVPLADGGAYAIGSRGEVWYLRGQVAVKVKEAGTLPQRTSRVTTKTEKALFALWQHERVKRIENENEIYEKNTIEP